MSKDKRKKKIVFLPYKAAMWDSLESIWRAAANDPRCDAYVVPIPYFERTADGGLGTRHYEIDDFPSEVPVIDCEKFDLAAERPDIIYIHNPYDEYNRVTSVDPRYYSYELRKITKVLMYVPYYATSGGMMEAQAMCNAYKYVDCIVIQAEYLRRYFSSEVPYQKIQALGSPKFDKVVRCCKNPPPIPEAWRERMQGKRVYFYNTSLGGMLQNTSSFLKKMRYVFDTFKRHPEVCLIWRPHPLMEESLRSMRAGFADKYRAIRDDYINEGWGIYDDTPDIERTIALSDVYIGDAGTSVTSLFGVAGKPVFLFENYLHSLPEHDDWRGELCNLNPNSKDWIVTPNGNFYHAPNHDFQYKYYGHFSKYYSGSYWTQVLDVGGKSIACPANCTELLELGEKGVERRIELNPFEGQVGVFAGAWPIDDRYVFLLPYRYPSLVRYDVQTGEVIYISDINLNDKKLSIRDFFVNFENSMWHIGASNTWRGYLVMTMPLNETVMLIKADTLEVRLFNLPLKGGCCVTVVHDDEIWFLPRFGVHVVCWEPLTGKIREYEGVPEGFASYNVEYGLITNEMPFSSAAFPDEQHVILAPLYGNMFVSIDRETGNVGKWEIALDCSLKDMAGYKYTGAVGFFCRQTERGKCLFFHCVSRRLYEMDFVEMVANEITISFDADDLSKHPAGFAELSEWVRYGCEESAFNTLEDLINGDIHGGQFDRERDLAAYGEVAANIDGTSGEKIHEYALHLLAVKG